MTRTSGTGSPGWVEHARDLVALAFLAAATWHLAAHDGGRALASLFPAIALGLLVLAATLRELAVASAFTRLVVAGWALGPLLALAFAEVRAGWVLPLASLSLAPPAWLAARHLWRRPAGPLALGLVLGTAALRFWWEAFLAYWGGAGGNAWLALSWHNQSATLMGAMALLGLGLALGAAGWVRLAGWILAAGGATGTWLAASRAGLALALLGVLVALVVALRVRELRRVATDLAVTGAATLALVLALGTLAPAPGTGTERIVERGLDTGNLMVRFDYWQGAWGMLAEAPLTGTGPGSYRWASTPHASFGTSRSASVHNDYLEVLAGHGLLGGIPVWLATLAAAWLVLGLLLRGPAPPGQQGFGGIDPPPSGGREAGLIAAAGALALLGTHAGFDFDWDYPVLLVVGAVAFGVLSAHRSGERAASPESGRRWAARGVALASAFLLVVGGWGVERSVASVGGEPVPWDLDGALLRALEASERGEEEAALALLEQVGHWNPGAHALGPVRSVVEHRLGLGGVGELREQGHRAASMDDRLLVAGELVRAGADVEAAEVLRTLRPFIEERRRWRVRGRVLQFVALELELAYRGAECEGVRARWPHEVEWAGTLAVEAELLLEALDVEALWRACLRGL